MTAPLPKVLFVDDEQNVLVGIMRVLRGRFDVALATGADQALQMLASGQRFQVIVSDMRMPGMDGSQLLARARQVDPDMVRLILSGHSDLDAAVRAINDGSVFRFLIKPMEREALVQVLEAAVAQHKLMTAERELLERTLAGSVSALAEVLGLANPVAFGRARRARRIAAAICEELKVPQRWAIEVAALLSQVGAVMLPPDTVARWYAGQPLSEEERTMVQRLPKVGDQLLAHIPRMEPVREILASLGEKGGEASLGARVVRVALDLEDRLSRGDEVVSAIATLRTEAPPADQLVLDACGRLKNLVLGRSTSRPLPIASLQEGQVLSEDVRTKAGGLLITRGHELTVALMGHLRNYQKTVGVAEPLYVEVVEPDEPLPHAA